MKTLLKTLEKVWDFISLKLCGNKRKLFEP